MYIMLYMYLVQVCIADSDEQNDHPASPFVGLVLTKVLSLSGANTHIIVHTAIILMGCMIDPFNVRN